MTQAEANEVVAVAFRSHGRWMRARAMRLVGSWQDAEDLLQQTFVRALRKLDACRSPAAIAGWLKVIMVNLARDHHRRQRRRRTLSLQDPALKLEQDASLAVQDDPAAPLVAAEVGSRAERLLASLPDSLQAVARDYYQKGLLMKQIAIRRGIPLGTVSLKLHRARLAMRRRAGNRS